MHADQRKVEIHKQECRNAITGGADCRVLLPCYIDMLLLFALFSRFPLARSTQARSRVRWLKLPIVSAYAQLIMLELLKEIGVYILLFGAAYMCARNQRKPYLVHALQLIAKEAGAS